MAGISANRAEATSTVSAAPPSASWTTASLDGRSDIVYGGHAARRLRGARRRDPLVVPLHVCKEKGEQCSNQKHERRDRRIGRRGQWIFEVEYVTNAAKALKLPKDPSHAGKTRGTHDTAHEIRDALRTFVGSERFRTCWTSFASSGTPSATKRTMEVKKSEAKSLQSSLYTGCTGEDKVIHLLSLCRIRAASSRTSSPSRLHSLF